MFSWTSSLPGRISQIKFIPQIVVDGELNELHPQRGSKRSVVCFKESVPERHQNLTWTSATLIPDWAVPQDSSLLDQLGIRSPPTLGMVLKHCQNLCSSETLTTSGSPEERDNIFKGIYNFLSSEMRAEECSEEIKLALGDRPIVIVEKGTKLINARKVVMQIENELPPFLYKLPRQFSSNEDLFLALGASKKPKLSLFSEVLQSLFMSSNGQELCPEELETAKKATAGY